MICSRNIFQCKRPHICGGHSLYGEFFTKEVIISFSVFKEGKDYQFHCQRNANLDITSLYSSNRKMLNAIEDMEKQQILYTASERASW